MARSAALGVSDVLAERLCSQQLSGRPARSPEAVVERLLAVQGQDLRAARLAIRSRSRGLAASDIDRALDGRRLLITWLNRGTLHLIGAADYPWLHALTTPRLRTANARRLAQEGVDARAAERGVRAVRQALAADGPLGRTALRERIARARVPTAGQALVHLLILATLEGHTVRGPIVGGEHAYVLVEDWLGAGAVAERERTSVDRERALAELARRYLRGHAPAADRDLAQWAGLPLRDARAGLAGIAGELRERADGLLELAGRGSGSAALPAPRLLGAFDPVLLGWSTGTARGVAAGVVPGSREEILDGHRGLVTTNGLFRPVALAGGRAAGTWKLARAGIEIELWRRLARAETDALERDGEDVVRYLGS
ncbi:MAG TPA: winged helix DNA-binding domain-containing protein [Solirubrobacteraceae bacterium]|nr:winged helix DNA-binding domain-containing protein [Solirubrobacteraceae bacterium]